MSRRLNQEVLPAAGLEPVDAGDLSGRLKELVRDVAPRMVDWPRPASEGQEPILDPQALIRELSRFLSDS